MDKNYNSAEQRMDTVGSFSVEAIKHWQAIKQANDWFTQAYSVPDASYSEIRLAFELWIRSEYGIELKMSEGGYQNYTILDQDKYVFFVLKFVK